MSMKGIAKATLGIVGAGGYQAPSGIRRSLQPMLGQAVEGTRLYRPGDLAPIASPGPGQPNVSVVEGTTQQWARVLVQEQGCSDLVLLNFASARNAGGGFLNGAKAQEEDLVRCSCLYPCLIGQPEYFEANRSNDSMLYTDHIIYSPKVPFFRARNRDVLEHPFTASVITAPAPNAGQHLRREPHGCPAIEEALRRRAGLVLAVAKDQGHRSLLLGAWGCGVFRNDPEMVADAFGQWLDSAEFASCFERVVFGVFDRSSDSSTLGAFQRRFTPVG